MEQSLIQQEQEKMGELYRNYNPTKFEDVVGFLNKVNKAVYGIEPFSQRNYPRKDGYKQVDDNVFLK